jgi:hypothetical protein
MLPPRHFRLLLIEDDAERTEQFRAWLPEDVRLVVAASTGRAMGTLQRDGRGVYGGIMLDHDLGQQPATEADTVLSGSHLVEVIIRSVEHEVPVLIHSRNRRYAPAMAARLDHAGFSVTQKPMDMMTKEFFLEWVEDARFLWLERGPGVGS